MSNVSWPARKIPDEESTATFASAIGLSSGAHTGPSTSAWIAWNIGTKLLGRNLKLSTVMGLSASGDVRPFYPLA